MYVDTHDICIWQTIPTMTQPTVLIRSLCIVRYLILNTNCTGQMGISIDHFHELFSCFTKIVTICIYEPVDWLQSLKPSEDIWVIKLHFSICVKHHKPTNHFSQLSLSSVLWCAMTKFGCTLFVHARWYCFDNIGWKSISSIRPRH